MFNIQDMNLGQKLQEILDAKGFKQADLIKLMHSLSPDIEYSNLQVSVSNTIKRNSESSKYLSLIAKALNMSPNDILNWGSESVMFARQASPNYTVLESSKPTNKVPLLSSIQAGDFNEAIEDLANIEYIETDAPINNRTFALRVEGESMLPVFQPGMIVIVDANMSAVPNDFVIAKNGDNEATLKQLVKDGADWYLKPLNPQYPTKPANNCTIVGVVIQAQLVTRFK